jgi:putative SOS response-associated peptidase YedK
MFAGLWDTWRNRNETITSCAIITTAANELVGELHDRMPAILPTEFHEAWLNRKANRRREVLSTPDSPRPHAMHGRMTPDQTICSALSYLSVS